MQVMLGKRDIDRCIDISLKMLFTHYLQFFVGLFTIIVKDSGMLGLLFVTIVAEKYYLEAKKLPI